MVAFWGDYSRPNQEVIDPRKNIRITWLVFQGAPTDDPTIEMRIYWKAVTVKGWTGPNVFRATLPATATEYTLPPNSVALDSGLSWKVEAWTRDKRFNPDLGIDPQPYYTDEFDTDPELISGTLKNGGGTGGNADASGYVLSQETNANVASGNNGFGTVSQTNSDPGEYEVRVSVQNGFQWSNWSALSKLVMYDTKKWVKKAGVWNAVPYWRKSGTMKLTREQ